MLTRDEVLSVIRLALNDLYLRFNYEITQKNQSVLNTDQDLTDQIEPHLRQALLRKPPEWPSGTIAEPKRYQDPHDALKVVDFGTTKGRRQLSITLHTPDTHDFNVLALL